MIPLIKKICELNSWRYINSKTISGGDISSAFSLETDKGTYFLKINSAKAYPQMFAKEAEGLTALRQASTLKVPKVISTDVIEEKQYLLMEFLEKSAPSKNFWEKFAEGLAALHKVSNDNFGWEGFNYIGSLKQQNNYETTWAAFYATQRIMPLAETLFDKSMFSKTDLQVAEQVCKRLYDIFPGEKPSLIHGDLWGGNFMTVQTESGTVPSIYDPAVYYGHREMDLGMSLLFGGFDISFYQLYNDFFPLEKTWRERVSLTQLYPLLVHAILFGGRYVSKCREILQRWK